jgi:FMN reductase
MNIENARMKVVAISGSPSANAKTAMLTDLIAEHLKLEGVSIVHCRVSAIAPDALLRGSVNDPCLAEVIEGVGSAHGIIVATPIYKATYSGMLKCFLDILPQFALAGKAILPI